MNNETVAVCIAAYNRADLIKETLEGLTRQTFKDFHIYLSWDGSTDNIVDVVTEYSSRLGITFCPYEDTVNAGNSKRKAVEEALKNNHKYIQMCDSDDVPLPDMLLENVNCLDKRGADWVLCWGRTFGTSHGYIHSEIKSFAEQSEKNYLHSWIMATAIVFKQCNFRETPQGIDDWDQNIRMFQAGFTGTILEKELYLYRVHSGRLTEQVGKPELFQDLRKKVRALNNIVDEAPCTRGRWNLYDF